MSEATLVKESRCSAGTVYTCAAPSDAAENVSPFATYVHGNYGLHLVKPFKTKAEAIAYHDQIEQIIAAAPDCPNCGKGKVLHFVCSLYDNRECAVCYECGHAPEPKESCGGSCAVSLFNGIMFR